MIKTILSTLFILSVLNRDFAQNAVAKAIIKTNGWYTSKEIGHKTWVINEPGLDDNMYLLEGRDSALLIDSGFGQGNLRDFVKSLTSKPLIVVNTHAHPDHTGGNYQFSKVHIGAKDLASAKPFLNFKITKQIANTVTRGLQMADSLRFPDTLGLNTTVLVPIDDNYVFKLGKRDIQVISVPGHSPGSLLFLDKKNKFLFTGDNTRETWLFFEESLSVEAYSQSLQKLNKFKGKFNLLLAGHGEPTKTEVLDELILCCQQILSGKSEAKPYHSFIGKDGVSCTYKTVTIAYDPNKVKL